MAAEGGRRRFKNREALEGILHLLRTGTPWRDWPTAYGPWHTIYKALATLDPVWSLVGYPEVAAAVEGG